MNEQFDLVRELFWEALDVAEPEQRRLFLEQRCQNEPALLAELQKMLDAHEQSGGFLEEEERDTSASAEQREHDPDQVENLTGQRIRGYLIREQLGEGGMGTVYVAEQSQPVQRRVALKVIRPGMATSDVLGRFQAERQALAMMDHPNIARIHDAGTTPQGLPFFAMELVRGAPITEYADEYRLSTEARLRLFQSVCNAVQHAHLKGIIHRDLKPNNVLVTRIDGEDVVKVIDFGVAKATSQRLTEKSIYTRHTQVIGTPMYMSPEQAQFSGTDVDTRSDVYSLGVLLYRLLSGRSPFESSRFAEADLDEVRRIIREETPPLPSEQVSTLEAEARTTLSNQRRSAPERMVHALRGELDWIVMKAMDKDRDRRYESASALAADIDRYLSGDPVLACPPSKWYLFGKFARKNAAVLGTSAFVLAMMVIAVGVSLSYADSAEKAEALANSRLEQSERDLERTLDAMNTIVGELTSAENAVDPAIVAVREASLKRVLEVYRQIALDHAEGEDVVVHQARAHFQASRILAASGEPTEALAEVSAGIGMFSELHIANKENPEFGEQLARALLHRTSLNQSPERSQQDAEKALAVAMQTFDKEPSSDRCDLIGRACFYIAKHLPANSARTPQLITIAIDAAERCGVLANENIYYLLADRQIYEENWPAAEANFRLGLTKAKDCFVSDSSNAINDYAQRCGEFATFLNRQGRGDEALSYHLASLDAASLVFERFGHLSQHRSSVHDRLVHFIEDARGELQVGAVKEQVLRNAAILNSGTHEAYARFLARLDSPVGELTLAIQTFPLEPWYLFQRSKAYRKMQRDTRAEEDTSTGNQAAENMIKAFEAKVEHGPNSQVREQIVEELVDFGMDLVRDGRDELALCVGETASQWTNQWENHAVLYEAKDRLGRKSEALSHLDAAIRAAPNHVWLYRHRAQLNFRMGNIDASLRDLRTALKLEPEDFETLIWLPPEMVARHPRKIQETLLGLADEVVRQSKQRADAYVARAELHYHFGDSDQSVKDIIEAANRPSRDLYIVRRLKGPITEQSTDTRFIRAVNSLWERRNGKSEMN